MESTQFLGLLLDFRSSTGMVSLKEKAINLTTKNKILAIAKEVFQERGFGEPTLNLIAQKANISRGNLTYYFKDKEVLLEAIAEEMWEEYESKIGRAMQFPSWGSTNRTTEVYLSLQQAYAYIFLDIKVSSHPKIVQYVQRMKEDLIKRQLSTIAFSVQIGNMNPEPIPGAYRNLCETLWMINFYWLASASYRKENEQTSWKKLVWSVILPYFTPKGITAFKAHFGMDFYESLGEKFQHAAFDSVGF